ncbi:MAG: site-specific DNA-methyltransferase [Treponema sp.]
MYIDPPYNTGAAFEHYDDNLEHSTWVSLMKPRLEILRNLLSEDGSILVQIDANELGHLKILMDEVFYRRNFVNIICVKTKLAGVSGSNLGKSLQDNIEFILFYAKNIQNFFLKSSPQRKKELLDYIDTYKQQGKSWKYTSVLKHIDAGKYIKTFFAGNGDKIDLYKHENFEICSINQIANDEYSGNLKQAYYDYIDKIFRTTNAQTSICTKVIEETKIFDNTGIFSIEYIPIKGKNSGTVIRSYYKNDNLIAWLKDVTIINKNDISKVDNIGNIWDDIQYNNLTKEGNVQFQNGKKPEFLISRILEMCTSPNDLVLDSFLGSGTIAAVAHKMGRRWIGIEMGEHVYTHCKVRLDKVISGEDHGGISKAVNWQGGGGYTFYKLAPTLINMDSFGQPIINEAYNPDMLSAAVALHEGFTYRPDAALFWKQSVSSEKSYLFVTTRHVTAAYLQSIQNTMQEGEYLTIACTSFDSAAAKEYPAITVKKIPQMLLEKCEFGKTGYSLNIVHPPVYKEDEDS